VLARRAIKVIGYIWLVLATVLLAIDILTIVGEPPPVDMFDVRGVWVAAFVVPWLIAVLATAACLSEMGASPRAHAPVWWLVVIMVAYGWWLAVGPVTNRVGSATVLASAVVVVVFDIVDLVYRRGSGRAATGSPRTGRGKQLRQP
jgi:hypothetical protein